MYPDLIYLRTTKNSFNFNALTHESLFLIHTSFAVPIKALQGSSLQRGDSGIQTGSILVSIIDVVRKELETWRDFFLPQLVNHSQSIGQN